jgi:hypothetical protein
MSKKKMKKRGKSAKIKNKKIIRTLWITIVIYIIIMGVDEQ